MIAGQIHHLRWTAFFVLTVLGGGGAALAGAEASPGVPMRGSVFLPDEVPFRERVRQVRSTLEVEDRLQPVALSVSLRLRNQAELQDRINRGEVLSHADLAARYLPEPATYERAARWLEAGGFKVTRDSVSRLVVFAKGDVGRAAKLLACEFAHVSTVDGREVVSASSPPLVPAELAPDLVCISGLQPHLPRHGQPPPRHRCLGFHCPPSKWRATTVPPAADLTEAGRRSGS